MGSHPTPGLTPTPTPTSPPTSGATPSPTPSPQPNYPPIPPLPDLPSNAYQLLLNLSSAIDTTSGSFHTSVGKIDSVHNTTNTAVGGVIANSHGKTTSALNDVWNLTKKDFTGTTTPLTSIRDSKALGGSPNQLQVVLDQHRSDFLSGIPAVEQLRHLAATNFASHPSVEVVQGLVNLAYGLTNALGNVNMVLWLMISAISNISDGISYACQTGFIPGQPFPTFTKQAFAMEGKGGSGSADEEAKNTINSLTDSETAELLIMAAEIRGVSLNDIVTLLQKGIDGDQIYAWLGNKNLNLGSVTTLVSKGSSIDQINAWASRGVNIDHVASLVDSGADLDSAVKLARSGVNPTQVSPLIKEGVSSKTILSMLQSGVNPADVKSVIEKNIAEAIKDSNPKSPLSRVNAINLLNGPDGTYPQVAGSGKAGADIKFIDPKTGNPVLVRELKNVTTSGGMTAEIRSLPAQLSNTSATREVVFQVPHQANGKSWIEGFLKGKSQASLAQYKGIHIVIVDPQGKSLWAGTLTK